MSRWRFFTEAEFRCRHTGEDGIDPEFVDWLDDVRADAGIPFVINSGYRHPTHPQEVRKSAPGPHTRGRAADIRVRNSRERWRVVAAGLRAGCKRVGVANSFVHLDLDYEGDREVLWLYS